MRVARKPAYAQTTQTGSTDLRKGCVQTMYVASVNSFEYTARANATAKSGVRCGLWKHWTSYMLSVCGPVELTLMCEVCTRAMLELAGRIIQWSACRLIRVHKSLCVTNSPSIILQVNMCDDWVVWHVGWVCLQIWDNAMEIMIQWADSMAGDQLMWSNNQGTCAEHTGDAGCSGAHQRWWALCIVNGKHKGLGWGLASVDLSPVHAC